MIEITYFVLKLIGLSGAIIALISLWLAFLVVIGRMAGEQDREYYSRKKVQDDDQLNQ